ncbi:hypothetical protein MVEN_02206800 [Mycena venus]|uniref:Uncharacterized protein n=1 Tax=Mycena venus TaxID=2733690 RepID=A0A8H7CFL6_9AGAR|nr:hypothetical protein MVEN_02206800 [Mycena venus]
MATSTVGDILPFGVSSVLKQIGSLALANRYTFSRQILEAARSASEVEVQKLEARGQAYMELLLLDMLHGELPADLYASPEEIIPLVVDKIKIALCRPPSAKFSRSVGAMCLRRKYDDMAAFLQAPLEDVFDLIRAGATSIPRPHSDHVPESLEPGRDPLSKLLRRFKACADVSLDRPRLMSDLRPALKPKDIALSKLPYTHLNVSMELAAREAHGDLATFLATIRDRELLTDGLYPSVWPTLPDSGWYIALDATPASRAFHLRQGSAALRAFIGEAVQHNVESKIAAGKGEPGMEVSNADLEILIETLIGNQGLLKLLYRLGVYQDLPNCPFEGMSSELPAQAFKLFLSALLCTANAGMKEKTVGSMLSQLFRPTDDIVVKSYFIL